MPPALCVALSMLLALLALDFWTWLQEHRDEVNAARAAFWRECRRRNRG